jgi:hypothetical protein
MQQGQLEGSKLQKEIENMPKKIQILFQNATISMVNFSIIKLHAPIVRNC